MDMTDAAAARPLPAPRHHVIPRRRACAVLLAVAVIVPTSAGPASAAVTPVALPQSITLFPERDFLGVGSFPVEPLTINVFRGAVKVGVAHGTPTSTPDDPESTSLLEVNHPGGVCWSGSTPDLLPGDRVEVLVDSQNETPGTANGQQASVQHVTAEPATKQDLDGDGVMDDVVVHGTAADAAGGRLTESLLEQRIINPAFAATSVGRRDVRATFTGGVSDGVATTGDVAWDSTDPTDTRWTATYADVGATIADLSVAGGTRVLAWERTNAADERIGMTIYEAGELGGPGIEGCPAAAVDAVTGTSPTRVNLAARAAGGSLVVNGVAHDASSVTVTVDDSDASTADALTATATLSRPASTDVASPLPGRQTWTASLPMADVTAAGLADGELTVRGTYQRVSEAGGARTTGAISGVDHRLLKDLVAPGAPTVSVPGGDYTSAQSVSLTAADPSQETVRYTLGAAPATPTGSSPVASGQLSITSSQTLRAVSFDRAGNPSPVLTAAYVIGPAPGAPTGVTAIRGNASVRVSWTAPGNAADSGVTGYRIRRYAGSTATVQSTVMVASTPLTATISGLSNGQQYSFDVTAMRNTTAGTPSGRSAVVVPATLPGAPVIGTASSGVAGGTISAVARWSPPASTGGAAITSYRVIAQRLSSTGAVLTTAVSGHRPAGERAYAMVLPVAGNWRFWVRAVNATGTGGYSARSNQVAAR